MRNRPYRNDYVGIIKDDTTLTLYHIAGFAEIGHLLGEIGHSPAGGAAPGEEVMGTSYVDALREAGLFAGGAEGRASFQIGKHGIEIESHLHPVRIAGILPVPGIIYQQCEVIVRIDGMPVLQRLFI